MEYIHKYSTNQPKSARSKTSVHSVPPALALAAFASSQKHEMIQAAGQIDSLHPAPSLTIAWPGTGTRFLQISSLGTECRQPLYANYIQLPWLLESTQFVPYAYTYIFIYLFIWYMIYTVYVNIKTIKYMVYVHAMILRRHMRKTPKKRRDHLGSPEITLPILAIKRLEKVGLFPT